MRLTVAASWVEGPLRQLVADARLELGVLLHPSGQVLGQFGFARSVDVMTACALAAATHASSAELGRMLEGQPFTGVHYVGATRQFWRATVPTTSTPLILFAVFDEESSLGLVQLFFRQFCEAVAALAPAADAEPAALAENFESELNRNLAVMFGRA
ncbi:MAG: hypothetical protein HY084_03815 [Gemmatimonadetes bacterium]|nr:hypothetical protein [Gemmatimonadota bacterium]